jgi:hypothetical protein
VKEDEWSGWEMKYVETSMGIVGWRDDERKLRNFRWQKHLEDVHREVKI